MKRRGQNTAEYAIVIALVVGAAIAMQTFIKRSLQGGTAYVTDKLSDGKQYEPHYLASRYATSTTGTGTDGSYADTETIDETGNVTRSEGKRTVTRSGFQVILDPATAGGN